MVKYTHQEAKERDSNIELLRIVCMLFILIHHFIIIVFYPDLTVRDGIIDSYRIAGIIINGFTYVGVNCFILISGYYGIKFRLKSLFNLYCICAFYALLTTLLRYGLTGFRFDRGFLYTVFLPFSHSKWWFITCYVVLFLLSPILNSAIQKLDHRKFVLSVVVLTVLNVYLGFYWHVYNINGYTVAQFVYIYFIGAFLRKYPPLRMDRKWSMSCYISGALLWSALTIVSVKWRVPHWTSFHYNNPFIIIASIGLFIFMTTIEIRSQVINTIASSVLAAYLLQDTPVYSLFRHLDKTFIYPLENSILKIAIMVAIVILGAVMVLGFAVVIDKFRLWLMKPVWRMYHRVTKCIKHV